MKIKVHSADLNRMMRTVSKCLDKRQINRSVIEIIHEDNLLKIHGTNGTFHAMMSTPLLGGDGERFCIDGLMFSKVIGLQNGEVEINADDRACVVKGTGRTRIPIVNASIPELSEVDGDCVEMKAEDFKYAYGHVAYAVSADENRIMLTGVFTETEGNRMRMVALDGFQMAIENAACAGDEISITIPGSFMDLVSSALAGDETLKLITDGKRIMAETYSMKLTGGLLAGEYTDYRRILPESFKTELKVDVDPMRLALKNGSVVNNKQKLVKIDIRDGEMKIMSNSEEADFEANIGCDQQGDDLQIAFNELYLINTMNAINASSAVMKFNTSVSPIIVQGTNQDGIHMCLPVRLFA